MGDLVKLRCIRSPVVGRVLGRTPPPPPAVSGTKRPHTDGLHY